MRFMARESQPRTHSPILPRCLRSKTYLARLLTQYSSKTSRSVSSGVRHTSGVVCLSNRPASQPTKAAIVPSSSSWRARVRICPCVSAMTTSPPRARRRHRRLLGALAHDGGAERGLELEVVADGPELADAFAEGGRGVAELARLGARDPLDLETVGLQPDELELALEDHHAALGVVVARRVMAVTGMAAAHEHAIGAALQRFEHVLGVDPSRARDAQQVDVCGVLHAVEAGEVGAGVSAPAARERQDLGPELFERGSAGGLVGLFYH